MKNKDYNLIAESIWRSGFIKDRNKIRQEAKEKIRRLIAVDLASSLKNENIHFDELKFYKACGIKE